jgi:hypothetical protein
MSKLNFEDPDLMLIMFTRNPPKERVVSIIVGAS